MERTSKARPWWESPEGKARLDHELNQLATAGIPAAKDEAAFAAGIARFELQYPIADQYEPLYVTFPDFYPYFRFSVEGPGLKLLRHQHPFGNVLCVLGRDSSWWKVSDTVASVLQEQMPKLLVAGNSDDPAVVAQLEESQAEPVSEYYSYVQSMILIDGEWDIPTDLVSGGLTLGLLSVSPSEGNNTPHITAAVLDVTDHRSKTVFAVADEIASAYNRVRLPGRWSRTPSALMSDNASDVFDCAEKADVSKAAWAGFTWNGLRYRVQIRGLVFPEEVSSRALGQGWVFAVRVQQIDVPPKNPGNSKFGMRRAPNSGERWRALPTYLSRAGRSGRNDLARRIPELVSVRDATITVFGAGCIGAPSILEFARSGLKEIRPVDPDIVDPATTVRWPYGLNVTGQYKVSVLSGVIREQYPYTKVVPSILRVGGVRTAGLSHRDLLDELLRDTSLVYDATADWAVQRFLSAEAAKRNLPYVAVSGTHGGWGGTVLRIQPGRTKGCWLCWRLDGGLPTAAEKANDTLQPPGCAEPTFTAAGFDMVEVAMQGVRMAMSTLCDGRSYGYPVSEADVISMSWRDERGTKLHPVIKVAELPRHPDCPSCFSKTR